MHNVSAERKMSKLVERNIWKKWNKIVLPGIYIVKMTIEKEKREENNNVR